jgi:hypothetical protein
MRVILHIYSQRVPKSFRLRCVSTGPRQIQYSDSSSYTGFNIQLNVSPLRLVVYRQIDACYNPHLLPNTGHNIWLTLCQLWSRSNPIYIQFLIFRLRYSNERISVDISDMSAIQYELYSTFAVKCSINPRDYAFPTLGPHKSNIVTVLLMQASIFNSTYIRCDWWFIEKSERVVIHIF